MRHKSVSVFTILLLIAVLITANFNSVHAQALPVLGKLYVYDPDGAALWNKTFNGTTLFSWSPDGEKIIVVASEATEEWSNITLAVRVQMLRSNGDELWSLEFVNMTSIGVSWSPSGSLIAITFMSTPSLTSGGAKSQILVYRDTGDVVWSSELNGVISTLAWSPHGELLAVALTSQITADFASMMARLYVFDSRGEEAWISDEFNGIISSLAWSPDGGLLAAGLFKVNETTYTASGRLYMFDTSGSIITSVETDYGIATLHWSPDGERIVMAGTNQVMGMEGGGAVYVFNRTGSQVWSRYYDESVSEARWSPDGEMVAVLSSKTLYMLSGDGEEAWVKDGFEMNAYRLSWRPSGDRIAVTMVSVDLSGEMNGEVLVLSSDGDIIWSTGELGEAPVFASWSPDGSMLAFSTVAISESWEPEEHFENLLIRPTSSLRYVNNTWVLSIEVKNIGEKPVTMVSIEIDGETINVTKRVEPGETVVIVVKLSGRYIAGHSYTVRIYTDTGSTFEGTIIASYVSPSPTETTPPPTTSPPTTSAETTTSPVETTQTTTTPTTQPTTTTSGGGLPVQTGVSELVAVIGAMIVVGLISLILIKRRRLYASPS